MDAKKQAAPLILSKTPAPTEPRYQRWIAMTTSPIIELVGLPGSGKSSTAAQLQRGSSSYQTITFPYIRRIRNLPFYIKKLPVVWLDLNRSYPPYKNEWFSFRDLFTMTILSSWDHELTAGPRKSEGIIILDEGPVVLMSWLKGQGSNYLNSPYAQNWWDQILKKWASALHLVIKLDTNLPTLVRRIKSRDRGWDQYSDETVLKMFSQLGKLQDGVLTQLQGFQTHPSILRFDTEQVTAEQISSEIAAYLAK